MFTLGAITCPSCASPLLALEFHVSPDGLDGTGRLRCPACTNRVNLTVRLAVVAAPKAAPDPATPDVLEDLVHVTGHRPEPEDHTCGVCGATFTTAHGVASHARTHETPAPCPGGCGKLIKPSGQAKHLHYCPGRPPSSGRAGMATPTGTPPPPRQEAPPSPPTPAPTAATPGPTTTPPAKAPAAVVDGSAAPAPKAPPPDCSTPPPPASTATPAATPPPSPTSGSRTTAPPVSSPASAPSPAPVSSSSPSPGSAPRRPGPRPSSTTPTSRPSSTPKPNRAPKADPPTPATIDEAYAGGPPLPGRSRGTCGYYYGPTAGVCGVAKDPGDDPWRRVRRDGHALDLCPAHTDLDDNELADAFENLAHQS